MSHELLDWAWSQPIKPASKKMVLLSQVRFGNRDGVCFRTIANVVEETGLDRKTVIKYLGELEAEGRLVDTGERRGATGRIKVYQAKAGMVPKTEWFQKRNGPDSHLEMVPNLEGNRPKFPQNRGDDLRLTATQDYAPPIVPPSDSPKSEPSVDATCFVDLTALSETENKTADRKSSCRFTEFWAAWPKGYKAGKPKALKAWKAKKLDAIADTLIADIEQRRQHDARWREGYIPNPATYLNQERWTDDFRPPKPKREQRDARQRIVDYLYDFDDDEPPPREQPAVAGYLQ